MAVGNVRLILVGGHESAGRAGLARLADAHVDAVVPGRSLQQAVTAAARRGELAVVIPMTFGRDPTMVADTAKTLRWLARDRPATIALAAAFGSIDHLTTLLRAAANRAISRYGASALLIHAPHSNPFDEAELHRVAYLVATYGPLPEVVVSIADDQAGLAASLARLRAWGHDAVTVAPAGFAASVAGAEAGVTFGGPLLPDSAIARIVQARASDARDRLAQGDAGIDAGLGADHGHGYAHSHAFEEASHGHGHGHGHTSASASLG